MPTDRGRLAMVVPYPFVPARTGGQHAISGYVRYLARAWPTVVIGTEENADCPALVLIRAFPDAPLKYFSPRIGWRVRRILRHERIRYLALQHHYQGLLLWPFTRGLGLTWLIFSHNLEYQRWRSIGKWWWPLMYASEWLLYRLADHVFFISPDDRATAAAVFGLPEEKLHYAPYGTDLAQSPTDGAAAAQQLRQRHGYGPDEKLLLFFGPQSYLPNREAVEFILRELWPVLSQGPDLQYRLLICGGGMPAALHPLTQQQGVEYLGFVDDIFTYIQGCDLVLNPIFSGGGVKTKLVEAVALGTTVVSSPEGARGVDLADFGDKLVVVPIRSGAAYSQAIVAALRSAAQQPTPAAFYARHYWGRGIQSVVDVLASLEAASSDSLP